MSTAPIASMMPSDLIQSPQYRQDASQDPVTAQPMSGTTASMSAM